MAAAVARAIESRRHLVVQAGTGVGKTLAYLIPVILSGRRTVISTATKSLQEQVASRDLPALKAAWDRGLSWAVVKGRGAYLCQQRVTEASDDRTAPAAVRRLIAWAATTETGDRDELDSDVPDSVWRRLSVRGDQCPGRDRCPSGGQCFAERARTAAATADLVITNHYVYAASLTASGQMLPEHDIAVFDEAHQLDEALRQMTSTRVDPARIARMIGTPDGGPVARLRDILAPEVGRYLAQAPELLDEAMRAAREAVTASAAAQRALAADGDERARRWAHTLALVSENLALSASETGRPRWVEGSAAEPVLRTFATDIGVQLALGDPHRRTAVLTSATLGADLTGSLGLDPDSTASVTVPSPFAYAHQALLYCAADLPDPRSSGWAAAAYAELAALINSAGGRTLALFTSWTALRAAVAHVAPLVGAEVLIQGELGRRELLDRFRQDTTSCLFATVGLAQGTDVPGDALTLVTLDRLPFPPAGDPYLVARRAATGPNAFQDVDLRHAQTVLAQVAGRLVRTATDRGVFAVLDPRLASAKYRWSLVRSVPPMARSRDRAVVHEFLRRCAMPSETDVPPSAGTPESDLHGGFTLLPHASVTQVAPVTSP
jgi:ATP-dependent DNA helicase DinG